MYAKQKVMHGPWFLVIIIRTTWSVVDITMCCCTYKKLATPLEKYKTNDTIN